MEGSQLGVNKAVAQDLKDLAIEEYNSVAECQKLAVVEPPLSAEAIQSQFVINVIKTKILTEEIAKAVQNALTLDVGIDYQDPEKGRSPLAWACAHPDVDSPYLVSIVQLLINHGADVDLKDIDGYSVLMLAVIYGQKAVLDVLIQSSPDMFAKNNEGESAFYLAAKENKVIQLQKIIKYSQNYRYGIDLNYLMGVGSRHQEILDYLKPIAQEKNKDFFSMLNVSFGLLGLIIGVLLRDDSKRWKYIFLMISAPWVLLHLKRLTPCRIPGEIPIKASDLGPGRWSVAYWQNSGHSPDTIKTLQEKFS